MVEERLPEKYLGIPLNQGKITRARAAPILDKIKKKLTSWISRRLSFQGDPTTRKGVTISWNRVCKPLTEGGL
ncbi:hypothetical protein IFM89_028960, partial [Coptis chinensis]